MLQTIKARCVNGALYPLEPVELQESGEYLVTVDIAPPLSDAERRRLLRSAAGSWRKDGVYWEQALQTIYESRRLGSRVQSAQQEGVSIELDLGSG